jgi:hypothetical protein
MNAQKRVERMRRYIARTTSDKRTWTLERYWTEEQYTQYQEGIELWASRLSLKHAGEGPSVNDLSQEDDFDSGLVHIHAEWRLLEPVSRAEAASQWSRRLMDGVMSPEEARAYGKSIEL